MVIFRSRGHSCLYPHRVFYQECSSLVSICCWVLRPLPNLSLLGFSMFEFFLWIPERSVRNIHMQQVTGEDKIAGAEKRAMYPQEEESSKEVVQPGLLTLGTAWTIGLSQRDSSGAELVTAACDLWGPGNSYPSLLYRFFSLLQASARRSCTRKIVGLYINHESIFQSTSSTQSKLYLGSLGRKQEHVMSFTCLQELIQLQELLGLKRDQCL